MYSRWWAILFIALSAWPARALTILTYNVKGNGATNWAVTNIQVQAIGRELDYLNPDVITFNEIPNNYVYEMTNFVATFLPGYYLATNSIGDGFIRNVIASRYPILASASYLHGSSLASFGYSGTFTRDLFQAEIAVPTFAQPVDIFMVHLKATGTSNPQNDATKRAAEAAAVSNFLVTVYLPTNGTRTYTLSGDLNEDVFRPETNRYTSGQPVQRLTSPSTGLQLTTPLNPYDLAPTNDLTESMQTVLDVRFDYILPCALLYSNIATSQVFRTDLLPPGYTGIQKYDDVTASDHLPVLMTFNNPYEPPFRLLSIGVTNRLVTLKWEGLAGKQYGLEASSDLAHWTSLVTNLAATGSPVTFSTNAPAQSQFYRVSRAQ